jgi:hypothetical protein
MANLWVTRPGDAAGNCARQATPGAYGTSTSCATFQAAYNASSCGDQIGVESGVYVNVKILSNGSSCSSNVTFFPVGGVVTFNADPSVSSAALTLGDASKCFGCGKNPPNHITFDGGPSKSFHFGTAGVQGSGGVMGQIKVYAAYGASMPDEVVADHITLMNLRVCNACPDPGNGTIELAATTNFTLSDNVIGPVCCGLDSNNNPSASPTELLIGNRDGFTVAADGLIEDNEFLGETRCGVADAATSCPQGLWPTSALGAPPQSNCNTSCHGDAVHDMGDNNTAYINNVFYDAQAQGIFLEAAHGPISNMTLVGNMVDSLAACGICAASGTSYGHWVIAFNTTDAGIGFQEIPDGAGVLWQPGFSADIVGNIGPQGNKGTNTDPNGCSDTTYLHYSYNLWVNGGGSNFAPCGTGDVVPGWTALSQIVVNSGDWNSSPPDNSTNYDLRAATAAANLVPAVTCNSYTTSDLHATPRPSSGFCDAGAYQHP